MKNRKIVRCIFVCLLIIYTISACSHKSEDNEAVEFYRLNDELNAFFMRAIIEFADSVMAVVSDNPPIQTMSDVTMCLEYFSSIVFEEKIEAVGRIIMQMESLQDNFDIKMPVYVYEVPSINHMILTFSEMELLLDELPEDDKIIMLNGWIKGLFYTSSRYSEQLVYVEDRLNSDFDYSKASFFMW